jgi:hypothetical protein
MVLNQIPLIPKAVLPDCDDSIVSRLRRASELDAFREHGFVVAVEIVGLQEEEDSAAGLVTYEGLLVC